MTSAEFLDVPDAELAVAAERGDRAAFGMLYLRHHEAAWRMASAAVGFTSDAETAVIDGFAAVFDELPLTIGPDLAFRRLLLRAVRRCAVDRLRRTGRPDQAPAALNRRPGRAVGDDAADEIDRSLMIDALRLIPEQWRSVLWLDAVENVTPPEAATIVGVDLASVTDVCRLAWAEVRDLYLTEAARFAPRQCSPYVQLLAADARAEMWPGERAGLEHHLRSCLPCLATHRRVDDPQQGLLSALPPVPLLGGEAQRRWLAAGRRGALREAAGDRGEAREARTVFDPITASVPAARRFVESLLLRWEVTELLDVARLLTSELVTNAVVHARSPIEVVAVVSEAGLRVEVHDWRPTLPTEPDGAADADRGRGLRIVDSLAHEWGALGDGNRKVVWFELTSPAASVIHAAAETGR